MSRSKPFPKGVLILSTVGLLIGYSDIVAQARSSARGGPTRQITMNPESRPVSSDMTLRRATHLLNEPLKNTQGVRLGKIDDLVLTPELNTVSYAVITRGGLFGLGQRRYAIPWSAMQAGLGDTIVAPLDERELDQDRGFRSRLWPAEGDPRWLSRAGQRTERVPFDVQPTAEQREIRRRRVSNIVGMTARGRDDQRVGTIRDMVIAMGDGEIPFTIVSYGGIFGIGNKYTAVPAGAIEFWLAERVARIPVNEQILRANAFDPGYFPNLADPTYAQRIYSAYDVSPQDPDWVVLGYIPPEPAIGDRITGTGGPQTTMPAQPRITQQAPGISLRPEEQTPPTTGSVGGNEYLSAFTPDKLRTIDGIVTNVSSFQLVGTNAEWVQLQVHTNDGELVTVHLGPRDYVSQQDFYVATNDRIILMGAQATAWRQPIILPITATVAGKTVTLRDKSGRPLWNAATAVPEETVPAPNETVTPSAETPDNTQMTQ
jgi:sporulation protein YlmC with PRC-barrel domain